MSVTAIILLAVSLYLLVKVVGFILKLGLIAVAFFALYWLVAPFVGAPPLF